MIEKDELRKTAKEIRNSLEIKKISEGIVKNILASKVYQNAKNIMIFYPIKHEVNLLSLLNYNKNFYLPKVDGENLLVCPYNVGDELTVSAFKTKEPKTEPVSADILDIIFVPALMVDKNFNRLGYGGGFYDKFLSKYALNAIKVVPISSTLVCENLPSEEFDEKIDVIVSEKFILK